MSVVALVLLMHMAVALLLLTRPQMEKVKMHELSVSVQPVVESLPALKPEVKKPQPRVERVAKTVVKEVSDAQAASVVQEVAESLPTVPVAAPVVAAISYVADTEPDYKAGYLHNPRPNYPMVARRMSWEGRVILNVEVLAEGLCGAVVVYRSSGHEVLDNAAMNTVKTWRFSPARHGGHAVTQWFKVPVNFSLEANEV